MQIQSGTRKILEISRIYNLFQKIVGKKKSLNWKIQNIWKIKKGNKVVDMGCGPGTKLEFLPEFIEYIGFDVSEEYINAAKSNYNRGTFILGTANDFLNNNDDRLENADIVICNGLLHHLEDIEVDEIFELSKKILKPGGRLLCIEPVFLVHQRKISKWIMDKDRGLNIRYEQGYKDLVSKYFENFTTNIATGFSKIPYVHIIIECIK